MPEQQTDPFLAITLRVADQSSSPATEFTLPEIRIGRSSAIGEMPNLELGDPTVSRAHAVIRWKGTNYWISDAGSLTGTYYDGVRLPAGDCRPLRHGTHLKFGQTAVTVEMVRRSDISTFDVFLCHSNADKEPVRKMATELRKAGLNPWIDESALEESTSFVLQMSNELKIAKTAAVIWGPNSPGRWQRQEIEYLQRVSIEEGVCVIPVILEGVTKDPDLPVFIGLLQQIDFRKPHLDPMDRLIKTVKKPPLHP